MSGASEGPDPTLEPWPQYATAIVDLLLDGEHLVLTPTADRERPAGDAHVAPAVVPPIAPWGPPVWVLTAGDPYPDELSCEENARRNATLRAELDAQGFRTDHALGRAPDGSASERSLAVRGAERATVLAAAKRHGQLAVYEIEDRILCVDVASGVPVTSVAYRLGRSASAGDTLPDPTGRCP